MISTHGRMKMYCKDELSKIENYYDAVNDKENKWVLHHRLELTLNGEFAHTQIVYKEHKNKKHDLFENK